MPKTKSAPARRQELPKHLSHLTSEPPFSGCVEVTIQLPKSTLLAGQKSAFALSCYFSDYVRHLLELEQLRDTKGLVTHLNETQLRAGL